MIDRRACVCGLAAGAVMPVTRAQPALQRIPRVVFQGFGPIVPGDEERCSGHCAMDCATLDTSTAAPSASSSATWTVSPSDCRAPSRNWHRSSRWPVHDHGQWQEELQGLLTHPAALAQAASPARACQRLSRLQEDPLFAALGAAAPAAQSPRRSTTGTASRHSARCFGEPIPGGA